MTGQSSRISQNRSLSKNNAVCPVKRIASEDAGTTGYGYQGTGNDYKNCMTDKKENVHTATVAFPTSQGRLSTIRRMAIMRPLTMKSP